VNLKEMELKFLKAALTSLIVLLLGANLSALYAQTIPTSFSWTSTGPLISAKNDSTHNMIAVKDPSTVYYNGQYIVYASSVNSAGNYGMEYLHFTNWSTAGAATPYFMDSNPNIGSGYHTAPQVFYFAPQNKWYLIFQSGQPQYSTNSDPTQPQNWTAPKNFFASQPSSVSNWIDFWIISDSSNVYLFFCGDNGNFYRSSTSLANFPNGFNTQVIVYTDSEFNLFEADNVYTVEQTGTYLADVECIGSDGHRFFRALTASTLGGTWTPLGNTASLNTPFLGAHNVTFQSGVSNWTSDFSSGGAVIDGYDSTDSINLNNLTFLYQGDVSNSDSYNLIPWQLALVTSKANTATTPTSTPVPPTATHTNTPVPPTATRTNTPIPPTATHTNTPVPPTATFTHTNTPVPPTATNSFTATHTSTPVPPTATRTNTPVPPTATNTNSPVPPTATGTATGTNTPVPPTATKTNTPVPPTATNTNSPVPPTVTNTSAPPTVTNTPAPPTATATNSPVPPTATTTNTLTATLSSTATLTPLPPTATLTPLPPTATRTNTPVPPTATNTSVPPTATNSPVPPTPTITNTPVPPTATRTFTPVPPTATHTPVPPTATFTLTPLPPTDTPTVVISSGAFTVQLLSGVTNDTTNSPHPFIQVVNTGTGPLDLNNVTVRYWFNCDCTNQTIQTWVDWAGLMPAGTSVTGDVVTKVQSTTLGGQTDYVLYSFTGNLVLQPGQKIQIQSRFNKNDWSNMNQANDWSFAPYTSYTNAPQVTGYLSGALVWGEQPAGAAAAALKVANVISFPNPSTGNGTTLSFTLGSSRSGTGASDLSGSNPALVDPNAKITLSIYSLGYRLIWTETLTGGGYGTTGPHDVYWNEKDLRGANLANGVYFLRVTVESNGQTTSSIGKILILG
jgi:endo-1,4-beta-xylanase